MTVTGSYTPDTYTGDASTVIFPYTFKIFAEADLRVILVEADGTEVVQTLTSDYSVSGVGVAGGGNVTMLSAPAADEDLVIKYDLDITQPYDYTENDPFPAATHENALDRGRIIDQQQQEEIDRCLKNTESDPTAIAWSDVTDAVAATAADVVSTNADVVLTHADVVLTGLDVDATNADVVSTNADVVSTNADAASTAADAVSTAADAISTAADLAAFELIYDGTDLAVDGTLGVTGETTLSDHLNLGAGADLIGSSTSDITINTNKFTVAGATGNTLVAGTFEATGAVTLTGAVGAAASITLGAGADLIGSSTSDITINTDKFTVAGATGNTLIAGTLGVTGLTNLVGNTVVGDASLAGDGTLHVHTASAGAVTASVIADDGVFENNDNGGVSILVPDDKTASLFMGTESDNRGGEIQWDYDAETNGVMYIGPRKANAVLSLRSGDAVEAARLDAYQHLLVGHTDSVPLGGVSGTLQVSRITNSAAVSITTFSNTNTQPFLLFGKSRGATAGTYTIVQNNDILGDIDFMAADGVDLGTYPVRLRAEVDDATPAANAIGGAFTISTATTAGALTEGFRMTNAQKVILGQTGGIDPDGTLHVHTASAGTIAATIYKDLILENDGSTGATFLCPIDQTSALAFGNPGDQIGASILWDYNGDTNGLMTVGTSKANAQLQFLSGNATELMRGDASQRLLIGAGAVATPRCSAGGVDISNGNNIGFVLGGDNAALTRTNATAKYARFGMPHYINAEQPVALISALSQSGINQVDIGGGTGVMNAATAIRFFTASDGITVTGTQAMQINSAGNVGIGNSSLEAWKSVYSVLQVGGGGALFGQTTAAANMEMNVSNNVYRDAASAFNYIIADEATLYQQINGIHHFYVAIAGAAPDDPISWIEGLSIDQSETVVNDGGADRDFRVESNTVTNALFVDGATGYVGLKESSPDEMLHLTSATAWKPEIKIENTTNDVNPARIAFYKTRTGNAADDDQIGQIRMIGLDDGDGLTEFVYLKGFSSHVANGDESGKFEISLTMDGTPRSFANFNAYNGTVNQGTITFNDDAKDVDTIIEAVGVATALKVQGSDGGVFMGGLKSGATQVAAGAAAGELWVTSGHASQEDNTVMMGV